MMKDDFKDGYRQGFADGFKLAKEIYDKEKQPYTPVYKPVDLWDKKYKNDMDHIGVSPNACKVCGMSFVDEMGRPKVMGYVCSHDKCPSKVTC